MVYMKEFDMGNAMLELSGARIVGSLLNKR